MSRESTKNHLDDQNIHSVSMMILDQPMLPSDKVPFSSQKESILNSKSKSKGKGKVSTRGRKSSGGPERIPSNGRLTDERPSTSKKEFLKLK